MTHEKIIKREDGTQYRILISLYVDSYRNDPLEYRQTILTRQKGKRDWIGLERDIYEHQYRTLSLPERKEYDRQNDLKFVSAEEIYEVKIELWNLLKPEL